MDLCVRMSVCLYLDSTASRRLQQHVFGLHVAVYDVMIIQKYQTLQHGVRELAHQTNTEPLEPVLLDQLVEVHGQQLERNTDVISEREMFEHMHNVGRVV